MPFGLLASLACHVALLAWAFWAMRGVQELPTPETPAISAEVITPSDFLRLKQGSEDAKKLETKAKEEPKPDDSKNETKKPDNAPPPPQEQAKVEEPPPPEPPKAEPPPPEPPKAEAPPPPPEPAPGPTPEEQKLLEQKIEEARQAEEKKKAEEEAKKKAEEAKKKKLAEEAKKKKLEEAKKKAEAEKKKFNEKKLAELLNKLPDDATPKALVDKDPTKKGQQASGTSQTAEETGLEAGTATGKDSVLSLREQDLLAGMIKSQLAEHWRLPGAGGGTQIPIVKIRWRLLADGSLDGEPSVVSAPGDALGSAAAEAAIRAVRASQPFKLPPESYEGWKDIEWVFDPRQML